MDPATTQAVADLVAKVTAVTTVEDSAIAFVQGVPALIAAAVAAVVANGGATAADLQPVTDLATALQAKADALSAAILASTPQAAQARKR